jgi:hypothetical protein
MGSAPVSKETKYWRLPSGKDTHSQRRYIREWRAVTKEIERILNVNVYAFDPDIAFCRNMPDGRSSPRGECIPLWLAQRIIDLDTPPR